MNEMKQPFRAVQCFAWLCLPLLLGVCGQLFASGFRVTPLEFHASPANPDLSATITNLTDKVMTVQARVKSWQQIDGRDVTEDSKDWLISPPISTLQPRATQMLRLRFVGGVAAQKQQNYRLYLDSLPERERRRAGIDFRFRVGLPVFMDAVENRGAALSIDATRQPGQGHALRIENVGSRAVRLQSIEVKPAGDMQADTLASYSSPSSGPAWLLPGSSQVWLVPQTVDQARGVKLRFSDWVSQTNLGVSVSDTVLWISELK